MTDSCFNEVSAKRAYLEIMRRAALPSCLIPAVLSWTFRFDGKVTFTRQSLTRSKSFRMSFVRRWEAQVSTTSAGSPTRSGSG